MHQQSESDSPYTQPHDPCLSETLIRAEFAALPPHKQEQTRKRVRDLLRREAQRRPAMPSYLWRKAKDLYGIDPETCR